MDKLPAVSYIRMVDIWLITVQLIPFIYVITRTACELVKDQELFNHHGRTIAAPEQPKRNEYFKVHHLKIANALTFFGNIYPFLSELK